MPGKKTAVFCIYHNANQAERVVDRLREVGFSNDDISVLLQDNQGSKDFAHEKNTKAPEGTTTGVTTGGVIGGTLGLLAGIGALAIPGLGPFIAAGPIMAGLGGLGVELGGLWGPSAAWAFRNTRRSDTRAESRMAACRYRCIAIHPTKSPGP